MADQHRADVQAQIDGARCHQCGILAEAVAGHVTGGEALIPQQVRCDATVDEHRRLGDGRPRQLFDGPLETDLRQRRAHDLVSLLEQAAGQLMLAAQIGPHADEL